MKQIIKLNSQTIITLPELIDSRLLVQANSGGGKSWLLRRILEQSHGKVQQIVIDLEGEFSTLREKYDYILAGKDGDVPANLKTAGLLARKILELNISAIIDLYELPHYERKHFVKLFLESMINAPKELWHSCLVVIDEAHIFCPEKGQSEAMEAVIDLATRGRKRGFCAVLATQRLSKLHKDTAAECNNKLIGRTGLDIDMKRASDDLGFTSKEQYLSLRKLEAGEFFAYGPAISNEVIKVKIGEVQTTHPKAGSRILTKTIPPTDKIKNVLKKLTDLPQESEKELRTIAEYKSEITNLRRELTLAKKNEPRGPATKIERIQVPVVGKRALEGMVMLESGLRKLIKPIKDYVVMMDAGIDRLAGEIKKAEKMNAGVVSRAGEVSLGRVAGGRQFIGERKYAAVPPQKPGFDSRAPLNGNSLVGPEQRILDAIAWMESVGIEEPEQTAIAFLAGYSYGGGAFNNPRGSLRSKGLVEYRGGKIVLTKSGRALAKPPVTALTTEELHKKVLSILPGPERKLLEVLLRVYPTEISNAELAERAGYMVGGGAFNNPRGRLRSLGLIEYRGQNVVARPILFLD